MPADLHIRIVFAVSIPLCIFDIYLAGVQAGVVVLDDTAQVPI